MRYRLLASAASLAPVITWAWLAAVPLAGQDRPSPAPARPFTTPWGDPDLQGIWTNTHAYYTPFERPVEFGNRQELTDAEFAARAELVRRLARNDMTGVGPGHWNEAGEEAELSRQTSFIVDPPDGRVPPLTPPAMERGRADFEARLRGDPINGPEDLTPWVRCITRGLPGSMIPAAYNNNYQILQTPTHVVILAEMIHEARIIPLDGRPHLGPRLRQWMGDPRGRWDGPTLVVDVTNFSPKTSYQYLFSDLTTYRGSGERVHLVERFTRVDARRIRYEVTIDDSSTFTRPWKFALDFRKDDRPARILEYACHEGNRALSGILAGARAQEKQ